MNMFGFLFSFVFTFLFLFDRPISDQKLFLRHMYVYSSGRDVALSSNQSRK